MNDTLLVEMRRWMFGSIIALIVFGCTMLSYFTLDHFYGEGHVVTSSRVIAFENYGQEVTVDNVKYTVKSVKNLPEENSYLVYLSGSREAGVEEVVTETVTGTVTETAPAPAPSWQVPEPSPGAGIGELSISSETYDLVKQIEGPLTISEATTSETKPINVLPVSTIIGVAVGAVAVGIWVSKQQLWGDATSMLLKSGMHDMTVRDVEIVGQVMKLEKFTISQLMKRTRASKVTIWRTVQKLIDRGVVRRTDKTIPSANGLGGRGKPSQVYEYMRGESE